MSYTDHSVQRHLKLNTPRDSGVMYCHIHSLFLSTTLTQFIYFIATNLVFIIIFHVQLTPKLCRSMSKSTVVITYATNGVGCNTNTNMDISLNLAKKIIVNKIYFPSILIKKF